MPATIASSIRAPPMTERVLGHVLLLFDRRGLQQTRDHGGKHLDMPDLLGADVQDHVLVLLRAATVPPLEEVVHHHADLAPLAAERLLEHLGEQRVRPLGPRVILQLLAVEEHRGLPERRTARCDAAWHRASGPSERRELAVSCAQPPGLALVPKRLSRNVWRGWISGARC